MHVPAEAAACLDSLRPATPQRPRPAVAGREQQEDGAGGFLEVAPAQRASTCALEVQYPHPPSQPLTLSVSFFHPITGLQDRLHYVTCGAPVAWLSLQSLALDVT